VVAEAVERAAARAETTNGVVVWHEACTRRSRQRSHRTAGCFGRMGLWHTLHLGDLLSWIGEKLNRMAGQVRFIRPMGGVSALDAPGRPFHNPAADQALFDALEKTVRQSPARQLIRVPGNVNDPATVAAILQAFREVNGGGTNHAGRLPLMHIWRCRRPPPSRS